MFVTIYEFLRGGAGLALIVASIAFLVDSRRGHLRLPLCLLYFSVGLLFSLSAMNPSWPDMVSDGLVLLLVYLVSQSFYELVLYLLGGARAPRRTSSLYWVGAAWTAALWAIPWLDSVIGWRVLYASVEDTRALRPLHAVSATLTYAWPVVVTVVALFRGRWRVRDIPLGSSLIRGVLAGCGVLTLILTTIGMALLLDMQVLYRAGHLLLTAWLLGLFWLLMAVPDLFSRARQAIGVEHKRRLSIGDHEAQEIDRRLRRLVTDHQVYRTPGLSVGSLARLIKVPGYRLSRHFSQHLSTTFPAWLNELRIQYVCDLLTREPDRTVLDIATDAGYVSKAVFHAQFEKAQGRSPSEYRRRGQAPRK
jgi:AraC-like DNA-binding protein